MYAYVFEMMQRAVDIVQTSPHPINKIAASLHSKGITAASTNIWPDSISKVLEHNTDIGNSSGTIHAEIACMLKASCTKDAEIFVTDPPCPNCVKAMAEAGIKRIYIDHKGFGKDFAQRRGGEFQNLSLPLCRESGIGVFEVHRKDRKTRCIQKGSAHITRQEPPAEAPFALARAIKNAKTIEIKARALTFSSFLGDADKGKYTPILEPITRLLMMARFEGAELIPDSLTSSRIPTARELVNMLGAGLTQIRIDDMTSARDIYGPIALKQLTDHKIITVIEGS